MITKSHIAGLEEDLRGRAGQPEGLDRTEGAKVKSEAECRDRTPLQKVRFTTIAYRREKESKQVLAEAGIESFLPKKYELRQPKRCKQRTLVPLILSMIFADSTKQLLDFKLSPPKLKFITSPYQGRWQIITIPDWEMQRFISVASKYDQNLVLEKGVKTRVHGTSFDGLEGYFVKAKSKRKTRVFLKIESLAIVVTAGSCSIQERQALKNMQDIIKAVKGASCPVSYEIVGTMPAKGNGNQKKGNYLDYEQDS